MDTDSFLNAFSRMTSRRGIPEVMFSDNEGNFAKAKKRLSRQQQTMEFNGHSILQEHHILVEFMK